MSIQVFPGIRAQMGEKGKELTYYIIRMKVIDLVKDLVRAQQIDAGSNPQLEELVQRAWTENRSTGQIAKYLTTAHEYGERFLGSFVIATYGGAPQWEPVKTESVNPLAKMVESDYGIFYLDGTQEYFVLDGQHRLESLKFLFGIGNHKKQRPTEPPEGLAEDQVSVLLISSEGTKSKDEFRKRLRRIFTALNRHAKPTTLVQNISIDEDDIAAVHTRRLLRDLDLFKYSGEDTDNPTVDVRGQQLREGAQQLTTIATIYEMNRIFSENLQCLDKKCKWFEKKHPTSATGEDFFKFAPSPEVVDSHYEIIKSIWEGLQESIKEWTSADRGKMKNHTEPENREGDGSMDHLLFWPVGQKGLARFLASKLNDEAGKKNEITKALTKKHLKNISKIDWDMFSGPWYGYVLRQRPKNINKIGRVKQEEIELTWSIHNQAAAETNVADMIDFLHGGFASDTKMTKIFRDQWENQLVLWKPKQETIDKKWDEAIKTRKSIVSK